MRVIQGRLITGTLKKCDRDKAFAWFDEDFEPDRPLSRELRKKLAVCWGIAEADLIAFYACSIKDLQQTFNPQNTKKPTLIVSRPVCADGLILQALGETPTHAVYEHDQRDKQIREQKSKLNQLINGQDETDFYKRRIQFRSATQLNADNTCSGVFQPRVFRGLVLSAR